MKSVSVIIVTYNSELEIAGCLESVVTEISELYGKIIIIDNASTDKTVQLIKKITGDNPFIKLIENSENFGYTKANNQGIKQANGEYIFLLNPDTILAKRSIQILIEEIENNNIGAIAPQLRFPDGSVQKSCRRFPRRRDVLYESFGQNLLFPHSKEFNGWKMGDFDHNEERFVDQPAGAALMVPKEILDKIGGLDEQFPMFFSDVDLCKQIWNSGKKILFTPKAQIIHKGGASIKRKRIKMMISGHLSFYKYFRKHYKDIVSQVGNLLIGIILLIGIPVRVFLNLFSPNFIRINRRSL